MDGWRRTTSGSWLRLNYGVPEARVRHIPRIVLSLVAYSQQHVAAFPMLAPRKKLWSTPDVAVAAAIRLLSPLTTNDVVYDIGCGDGRFLVECATQIGCRCVGIEIDEVRAAEAVSKVEAAGLSHLVSIIVGNALEADFSEATAMFLYLIPRGLRIMLPMLRAHSSTASRKKSLKVATYMKGFREPDTESGEEEFIRELVSVAKVTPPHQPDAQWPVYLFEFRTVDADVSGERDETGGGGGEKGGEAGGGSNIASIPLEKRPSDATQIPSMIGEKTESPAL